MNDFMKYLRHDKGILSLEEYSRVLRIYDTMQLPLTMKGEK